MHIRGHVASACSAMLHGGILLVLIAASYLHVEALSEPASRQPGPMPLLLPPRSAGPAAPASGRPAAGSGRVKETRDAAEPLHQASPPQEVPADVPPPLQEAPGIIETGPPAAADGSGGGDSGGGGDLPGTMGGGPGGGGTGTDGGTDGDGPGGDAPVYLTGDVRPPRRTAFVKPEYPEMARKARAEGKVILEIVVGRTGEIEDIRVLRSAPLFDQAAIEAVARWRYQPALQSGRP